MIEGLLEDDNLLQSIFEESNLTKTQLDSLLLAFQYKIEGYSLDEIVKMRDSGPVSKGSYLRTLGQAQSNFRSSLYTLLLVVYLGILDTSTVADSPVVPTTTIAEVPESICQSIKSSKDCQQTVPSSSIGVTKATIDPFILNISNVTVSFYVLLN